MLVIPVINTITTISGGVQAALGSLEPLELSRKEVATQLIMAASLEAAN